MPKKRLIRVSDWVETVSTVADKSLILEVTDNADVSISLAAMPS